MSLSKVMRKKRLSCAEKHCFMRVTVSWIWPALLATYNRQERQFEQKNCRQCLAKRRIFLWFRPNKETAHLDVVTLQKRYEGCQKNVKVAKPYKPGSKELNDLEYFHTYLSNGLPMSSGVFRK